MPTNTVVGSARAIFTISLVAAATEEVRVDWATKDGTALAGRDYETNSGTVAFAPGETSKTVEVFVHGRTVETEDRVFYVLLDPPVNALLADEIGACVIHVDAAGTVPVVSVIIPRGEKGLTGDSAYQIALNNGFVGTQPEWLASLRPSAAEIAPLVAPLINASIMSVTAAGTEDESKPDTDQIKGFAGRIAYMRRTKHAVAPSLSAGNNVVPLSAFVGDPLDPTMFSGFNVSVLRAGVLVPLKWEFLTDTNEIKIYGALSGDIPLGLQQDVGSGDISAAPVKVGDDSDQLRGWIAALLTKIAELDATNADLANSTDPSKGVSKVGGAPRSVASIAAVRLLPKTGAQSVSVSRYANVGPYIDSKYVIDLTDTTSLDDGVLCLVAVDGGRWKLCHNGVVTLRQCGAFEDGVTNDTPSWVRAMALVTDARIGLQGISIVSATVTPTKDYTTIFGMTKKAGIKSQDNTNHEITFSAVERNGLLLENFTVDANYAGRSSKLTTRTIAVSLVSCTDSDLIRITGKNAVGSPIGGAGIPGVGISTSGGGDNVNTLNCRAIDCGVAGKAADGFFCSSSNSTNKGNKAIRCLDTGHVLESCNNSSIEDALSLECGVIAAITNATSASTYGNRIAGITGRNWSSSVTGGIQIAALGTGDLLSTKVSGVNMYGVTSSVGPAINVRKLANKGTVKGLTLDVSISGGGAQGLLIDSAEDVSVLASISGTTDACIQVQGTAKRVVVASGTNLKGGSHGLIALDTAQVKAIGISSEGAAGYGIYAFGTSRIISLVNDIKTPGFGYEGKDSGAFLERFTLINGLFSLESIVAGAPLTAGFSSKFTVVNKGGNVVGVTGLSTT